jgi:hypothetical protein
MTTVFWSSGRITADGRRLHGGGLLGNNNSGLPVMAADPMDDAERPPEVVVTAQKRAQSKYGVNVHWNF